MNRVRPSWLFFLALIWWILADPLPGRWVAGALALAVGSVAYALMGGASDFRFHLKGLAPFLSFFLYQSVRGGLDVSRRALSPSLPVTPRLMKYRVLLPEGLPRVSFVATISLLPGTFSAELEEDDLTVHLLTNELAAKETLKQLEQKVGAVFGLSMP